MIESRKQDDVLSIEPNYVFSLQGEPTDDADESTDPNDPYFDDQWGLDNDGQNDISGQTGMSFVDTRGKDAWDISDSNIGPVVVGVIDSGVDYTHPDLENAIWINPGEFPNSKFPGLDSNTDGEITLTELTNWGTSPLQDFDSNGSIGLEDLFISDINNVFLDGVDDDDFDSDQASFVDDFLGWDFVNNDNNPMDDNSHGTHVSGIIAAERNNSIGIAGISPNARIFPIKAFSATGSGSSYDLVLSVEYATAMDIPITNNSWGITIPAGSLEPTSLRIAIEEAGANGYIFVGASGNGDPDTGIGFNIDNNALWDQYPALFTTSNIIIVGASDNQDSITSFSNWGELSVDVMAPGKGIISTVPTATYAYANGTSMATPFVSGSLSVLYSYLETKESQTPTPSSLKTLIMDYSENIPSLSDKTTTDSDGNSGIRLNLYASLPPITTITYNPPQIDGPTINNVISTLTSNKPGTTSDDPTLTLTKTYEFSDNGTYLFDFVDESGQEENITAEVSWIQKLEIQSTDPINRNNFETYEYFGTCIDTAGDINITIDDTATPETNEVTDVLICNSGTWSYTIDFSILDFIDGDILVDVSQDIHTDATSNLKDTLAPSAPVITSPASNITITSLSYILQGTAEADSTITVTGGETTETTLTGDNGEFIVAVALLENQVNSLSATATDTAGNTSDTSDTILITNQEETSSRSSGGSRSSSSSNSSSSTNYSTAYAEIEQKVFNDVDDTNIFKDYIENLYQMEVIDGYSDGTFKPERKVTRGEMSKFSVNGFQIPIDTSGETFIDIDTSNTFFEYIQTLKNLSIINGYSDGTFKSEIFLTRGAATKFIVLALQSKGLPIDLERSHNFSDVDPNSEFSSYIAFLATTTIESENIISGFSDNTFRPEELITRAQMAKIIYNSYLYTQSL